MKNRLRSIIFLSFFISVVGFSTVSDVHAFNEGDRVVLQNTLRGHFLRDPRRVAPETKLHKEPIRDGTRVTFLEGPKIDREYIWYKVKLDGPNGLAGWIAEPIGECSYIGSVEEAEKRDAITAALFQLSERTIDTTTHHDYNGYGCNINSEIYGRNGHSGLDVQTDARTKNEMFYSLTDGIVTIAGFTDKNGNRKKDAGEESPSKTIGIYDPEEGKTTFYLHASWVHPDIEKAFKNKTIVEYGDPLGTEGDTGSLNSIHVHLEVHTGESKSPLRGKTEGKTEDPIKHLYEWTIKGKIRELVEQIENLRRDVNNDGEVDIHDLILVWQHIGQDAEVFPQYDMNRDGLINHEDLNEILDELRVAGAPTQTTDALLPSDTYLFNNYPNPFNPETWIPYQLANAGDVRINIYNAQGVLVRVLPLGHQRAGYYTNQSQAAYWDGRNTLGEPVASGVYFYQLETDKTSLMRKMVILK